MTVPGTIEPAGVHTKGAPVPAGAQGGYSEPGSDYRSMIIFRTAVKSPAFS